MPTPLLSLEQVKSEINNRLKQVFIDRTKQARKIDPLYQELLSELGNFVGRGGKRLRPYLVYLSYIGFGGANPAAALDAAVGQELYHSLLLIHDDIIDRDLTRYGGPNLSGVYTKKFEQYLNHPNRARHYADSVALLGGDLSFGLASDAIMESDFSDSIKVAATRRLNRMLFEIAGGEMLDVVMPLMHESDISHKRLLQVCHYKTASYSFSAPLQLGAILAETPQPLVEGLDKLAIPWGIAFQIVDDLLGIFGDEKQLGKPILTDLREGKRTLLMSYGLSMGNDSQKDFLISCLGNPAVSLSHLDRVKQILIACGAHAATRELAQKYISLTKRELDNLEIDTEVKQQLAQLADFTLTRSL